MGISYNASTVRNGLVLHLDAANVKSYPGSGTTWFDLSGNNNDGVATGAPSYSPLESFTFGGSGDFFDCGENSITGSAPFTLASWFKTATLSKYSGALSIGGPSNGPYIGTVTTAQVGTSSSIGGGFFGNNWGTGVTDLNTWLYVVMTYAGGTNGLTSFYVNGEVRLNQNYVGTPNIPSTFTRVGRITASTIYDFNGSISISKIYNRSLTLSEIRQNFEATRGRYGI